MHCHSLQKIPKLLGPVPEFFHYCLGLFNAQKERFVIGNRYQNLNQVSHLYLKVMLMLIDENGFMCIKIPDTMP